MSAGRVKTVPWRQIGWTTGLVGVAAALLGSTYSGLWPTLLLTGLCLMIAVLTVVGQLAGLPRMILPVVLVIGVLIWSVLGLRAAPKVGLDADAAVPIWKLLIDSVPRLLTTPDGTPTRLDLVAPAMIAVTVVLVVALVRAQIRGRSKPLGIAAALAAGSLYAAAMVLTAGRADRYGLAAALLVIGLLLAWSRPRPATLGVVLTCGACATLVAAFTLPAGRDVRELVDPPQVAVAQPNVLPYLSMWSEQTDLPLFTVSGVLPDRIALATYSRYNGISWSSGTSFAVFGSKVDPGLPAGGLTAGYDMSVTITDLPTNWLPSAGKVRSVSLPGVVQDLTDGGLLRVGTAPDPLTYQVSGLLDVPEDARLTAASVPDAEVADGYLDAPPLPYGLSGWVDDNLRQYLGRYQQAAALETLLREGREVDPELPGNSSIAAVEGLVLTPAGNVSAQEQFASAYALLGRAIGLPTRVVVGVRLDETPGIVSDGTREVRAGDIGTWPEVYFDGVGWVPFEPAPIGEPTPAQKKHADIRDGGNAENVKVEEGALPPPAAPGSNAAPASDGGNALAAAGIALGVALLLLLLASVLAGIGVRSGLRRQGARGAWTLIERASVLAGLRVAPSWTTGEFARQVGGFTRQEPIGDVAATVAVAAERSAYAPVGADGPGQHWAQARQVVAALRRRASLPRKLLWYVRPAGWRALPTPERPATRSAPGARASAGSRASR